MTVKIIRKQIPKDKIEKISTETFGNMIKAVVDTEKKIIAIGGDLHSDTENILLEDGSEQKNLWGINLYLQEKGEKRIEFSALINIRPVVGNRSMWIEDENIRIQIEKIVNTLIPE